MANAASVYRETVRELPSQWQSTDTTTDINVVAPIELPLFGINVIPHPDISLVNVTTLKFDRGGFVRVTGNVPFVEQSGVNLRFNTELRLKVDGTVLGNSPKWRSNYMRDGSGHNETSQELSGFTFHIDPGSIVSIESTQLSGVSGGTVVLDGANLEFEYIL